MVESAKVIDLVDLLHFTIKKWRIYVLMVVIAIPLAFLVNWYLPKYFTAHTILKPAQNDKEGGLAQVANQFSGIASFAGLNLLGGGKDRTKEAIAVLRSQTFIEKFIYKNGLETDVFATNGWDRKKDKLLYDQNIYDEEKKEWVRDYNENIGQTLEPSGFELYETFVNFLSVEEVKKTGFVEVSIRFYSPRVAKKWLEAFIEELNHYFRSKDKADAEKMISYLNSQLELTNVVEMQSIFYGMIEEKTKQLALAEVDDEYVLKYVIEPVIPFESDGFGIVVIIILLNILLVGLSVLFVIFIYINQALK